MSMHKQPLTMLEREGLEKHSLPIDTPSQLSDSFRLGIRWALQSGYADHSHKCRACGFAYTPPEGATEDCPACGHGGAAHPSVQKTQSHREWLEEKYADNLDGSWGGHP